MLERVGLRYSRIWRAAVGLLATIGVVASLVFVPPATILVAFLLSVVTIGAVCLSFGFARELPAAELIRSTPRWAGLGGLTVLTIYGYAAAVGLETLVLLALIGVTSPPVAVHLLSRPDRQPVPEQDPDVKLDDVATIEELSFDQPDLREMTDEELCLAWRRSFGQLHTSLGGERRLAMADIRRAYLDELERRQPEAFAAWIASGARAAGDPRKFFTQRADHHD